MLKRKKPLVLISSLPVGEGEGEENRRAARVGRETRERKGEEVK